MPYDVSHVGIRRTLPANSSIEENGGSVDAGAYCHVYSVSDTDLQLGGPRRSSRENELNFKILPAKMSPPRGDRRSSVTR